MRPEPIISSQYGFSVPELLVAIAIAAGLTLGSSRLVLDLGKVGNDAELVYWVAARRLEVEALVRSQDGWNSILASNPTMECFATDAGCGSSNTKQGLNLPIDGAIINGTQGGLGLNRNGDFCTNYSSSHVNLSCPVGVSFYWQADCGDPSCQQAQPKVIVEFHSKRLNVSSYNLTIYKDPKIESLNQVCSSMGGVFVGNSCTPPQLLASCDPANGSFLLGFDNMGNAMCGRPNPGVCAGTDVATGFDGVGGLVCAPRCP